MELVGEFSDKLGVVFEVWESRSGTWVMYETRLRGQRIATCHFDLQNGVQGVRVSIEWRRRGIATALYDLAEKRLGVKLKPTTSLTAAGRGFWEHRLGKPL